MERFARRVLYFFWFICDAWLILRAAAALSGGRLPIPQADWRNAVLVLAAMALTAAAVYPVFRRMPEKRSFRIAGAAMSGAGYMAVLTGMMGAQWWPAALPLAAAGAYITVWGLKKPDPYW